LSRLDITEIPESRGRRAPDRMREEATAVLARTGQGVLLVFDERGRSLSSEELALRIRGWREAGRPRLSCIVGGPDGLDRSVRDRADLVLSFGALTIPHALVRILVAEQLYRAVTILAGHPYHRGSEEA
jgi:23S rRNA (pseudouridine1915-N3)-methyltransferase